MIPFFRFFIAILPSFFAAKLVLLLASFPIIKPKLKARDHQAFAAASSFRFKNNSRIAYSWGNGPLIIMVHGWEGRASQFASIAQALAASGYQAVAYDGKAHGLSQGKAATFLTIQEDLKAITEHFNKPVHAFVAHSAGGLSLMAALSKQHIQAKHFITIASPKAPYPFVASLKQELGIKGKTESRCKALIAKQFDCSWQQLENGHVFKQQPGQLLAMFDHDDDIIHIEDARQIEQAWPGAQVFFTNGLGHIKILWDQGVIDRIIDFVALESGTQKAQVKGK